MRGFCLVALLFLLTQQDPGEAYPGQSEHREPPKGWFCSAEAKDKAHVCHCKRMAKREPDDPFCESTPVVEDAQCKVWCHPQHCTCPVTCDTHHP